MYCCLGHDFIPSLPLCFSVNLCPLFDSFLSVRLSVIDGKCISYFLYAIVWIDGAPINLWETCVCISFAVFTHSSHSRSGMILKVKQNTCFCKGRLCIPLPHRSHYFTTSWGLISSLHDRAITLVSALKLSKSVNIYSDLLYRRLYSKGFCHTWAVKSIAMFVDGNRHTFVEITQGSVQPICQVQKKVQI